jgi:hypothetical protein
MLERLSNILETAMATLKKLREELGGSPEETLADVILEQEDQFPGCCLVGEEIFESEHPYKFDPSRATSGKVQSGFSANIPCADFIVVSFHPRSSLRLASQDCLEVENTHDGVLHMLHTVSTLGAWKDVIVPGTDSISLNFTVTETSDRQRGVSAWGWRAVVRGYTSTCNTAKAHTIASFECQHPYDNNMNVSHEMQCAQSLFATITFDPQCHTETDADKLIIQAKYDAESSTYSDVMTLSGASERWPKVVTILKPIALKIRFTSDDSGVYWGYKFDVKAFGSVTTNGNKQENALGRIHHTIAYFAGRLASLSAFASVSDDTEAQTLSAIKQWSDVVNTGITQQRFSSDLLSLIREAPDFYSLKLQGNELSSRQVAVLRFFDHMYQWGHAKHLTFNGALGNQHPTFPATACLTAALAKYLNFVDILDKSLSTMFSSASVDELLLPKCILELWKLALTAQASMLRQHSAQDKSYDDICASVIGKCSFILDYIEPLPMDPSFALPECSGGSLSQRLASGKYSSKPPILQRANTVVDSSVLVDTEITSAQQRSDASDVNVPKPSRGSRGKILMRQLSQPSDGPAMTVDHNPLRSPTLLRRQLTLETPISVQFMNPVRRLKWMRSHMSKSRPRPREMITSFLLEADVSYEKLQYLLVLQSSRANRRQAGLDFFSKAFASNCGKSASSTSRSMLYLMLGWLGAGVIESNEEDFRVRTDVHEGINFVPTSIKASVSALSCRVIDHFTTVLRSSLSRLLMWVHHQGLSIEYAVRGAALESRAIVSALTCLTSRFHAASLEHILSTGEVLPLLRALFVLFSTTANRVSFAQNIRNAADRLLKCLMFASGLASDDVKDSAIQVLVNFMFTGIIRDQANSRDLLLGIAQSLALFPVFQAHLSSNTWCSMLLQMAASATLRTRLACLRLLRRVLPSWALHLDPENHESALAGPIHQNMAQVVVTLIKALSSCLQPHNQWFESVKMQAVAAELIRLMRELHAISGWNEQINVLVDAALAALPDSLQHAPDTMPSQMTVSSHYLLGDYLAFHCSGAWFGYILDFDAAGAMSTKDPASWPVVRKHVILDTYP